MTSFKNRKKLYKVFPFFWLLFSSLNDVIRNPLRGIIGFVIFLYILEVNDHVWRAIVIE